MLSSAGTGRLAFALTDGRTQVRQSYATSPLKLLNPRNHGSAAWVFSSTYGGGLVGGDAVNLQVTLERGARAYLSTQASTKVFRSSVGASQTLHASVGEDALLVVAPDPVVCFAASTYCQEQHFALDRGAGLVAIDWLSSGRLASGERWAFESYRSRMTIGRSGRRLFYDSLRLATEDGPIADRMDRFNVLLVAAIIGPPVAACAANVLKSVRQLPIQRRSNLLISAAPLDHDGVLLRMAGVSVEDVGTTLRHYLSFLGPLLGDDPWARKW